MAPRTPPSHLDWSDLQYFAAVCEAGSVSRAADVRQVNHTTVLRRIVALEESLGTALFDRGSGGYVLTAAGQQLLSGLAGMPDRIAQSPRHVGGLDEEVVGEVRLTSTDTLMHGMLMPLIDAFCTRHPGIRVRIVVNNHFLSLTRREADVAIRASNRPPDNLVGRRVGAIQVAPYASRAYLRTLGRRPALAEMDWIAVDESLAHIGQARWLVRHVPAERVVMSVDSLIGMVHAVEHGIGAAMLLCPLADARPDLVRLAPPEPSLDTEVWVLTHPDLRQVARVRAFAQFMFDALAGDARLAHP